MIDGSIPFCLIKSLRSRWTHQKKRVKTVKTRTFLDFAEKTGNLLILQLRLPLSPTQPDLEEDSTRSIIGKVHVFV